MKPNTDQPEKTELESARRIGGAINKAGIGSSSNMVMVVL